MAEVSKFQKFIRVAVLCALSYLLVAEVFELGMYCYSALNAEPAHLLEFILKKMGLISFILMPCIYFSGFRFKGISRYIIQALVIFVFCEGIADYHAYNAIAVRYGVKELMAAITYPAMLFYKDPVFLYYCLGTRVTVCIAEAAAIAVFYVKSKEQSVGAHQVLPWVTKFRMRMFTVFGHSFAFLIVAGLLTHAIFKLALEGGTSGNLKVRPSGIYSKIQVFKKQDQTVVVYPMIHIGDRSFYKNMAARYANEDGITLLEGVRGGRKELEHLNHRELASVVGVSAQADELLDQEKCDIETETSEFGCKGKMRFINADVDFSEFKPFTQKILTSVGQAGLLKGTMMQYEQAQQSDYFLFAWDIEDKREDRLFKQFEKYQHSKKFIVIPWGAAHSFEISRRLTNMGFNLQNTEEARVIAFGRRSG